MGGYPPQRDKNKVDSMADTAEVGITLLLRVRRRAGPRTSGAPKGIASKESTCRR